MLKYNAVLDQSLIEKFTIEETTQDDYMAATMIDQTSELTKELDPEKKFFKSMHVP